MADENNVIKLKYATNKCHIKATFFDINKGIFKFKAEELKQELDECARAYEEGHLLNFRIILF